MAFEGRLRTAGVRWEREASYIAAIGTLTVGSPGWNLISRALHSLISFTGSNLASHCSRVGCVSEFCDVKVWKRYWGQRSQDRFKHWPLTREEAHVSPPHQWACPMIKYLFAGRMLPRPNTTKQLLSKWDVNALVSTTKLYMLGSRRI